MVCPKCGSANVNVQIVSDVTSKTEHHGVMWWLFVSWWWIPVKWLCLTLPALLAKIFIPKRKKVVTTHKNMCVCQKCGNTWQV